jgi:hypothetical protein
MIRHNMPTRAQGLAAFTTILAACIAGIIHLSWWAAPSERRSAKTYYMENWLSALGQLRAK